MALVAHEFGLLVALVAVRAVDVAQVRVVRIGFVLGGLLSERLIAVALLADVLLHLRAFSRRGLVAGGKMEVSRVVGSKRRRGKSGAEAKRGGKSDKGILGHFEFLPVIQIFAFLARAAISRAAMRPKTVAAPSCAPPA